MCKCNDVEKDNATNSSKTSFQICAILSGCLASITCGFHMSWTSPSIVILINDKENYNITLEEASYLTVLQPFGVITSCLLFSYLNDKIGRKYTMLLVAVPHITAFLLIAFAKSIWIFYLARFIVGLGDANLFATLPMYVGEIASPKVRGTWGNSISFCIYFGQLLINIYGSYFTIRATALISLIAPVLFLLTFSFMPESPYFYLMKKREENAKSTLQRLRQTDDVDEEFAKLKNDVERQMSETGTWADLFTIRSNFRGLLIGIFLRSSQQLSGFSAFTSYTQYLFSKSGTSFSFTTSTAIFMSLLAFLNLVASCILDKVGRKRSCFFSQLFAGIFLMLEAIYFFLDQFSNNNLEFVSWIPLTGMILWAISFAFGLGIVPTLMMGELFSTSIKGKGLCVLNIVFSLLVCSSTKLFQVLSSNVGMFAPFLFFSICCFICCIMGIYVIPETSGKTLEEIQQELKK